MLLVGKVGRLLGAGKGNLICENLYICRSVSLWARRGGPFYLSLRIIIIMDGRRVSDLITRADTVRSQSAQLIEETPSKKDFFCNGLFRPTL